MPATPSRSRQRFILRVRTLARAVARAYYQSRLEQGFPLAEAALAREEIARHQEATA